MQLMHGKCTDWVFMGARNAECCAETAVSFMQESCQSKGLDVQSIVLLATVPIVPVPVELNHKVGYIVGPTLAVLAIFAFFGTLFFLHLEKERDLRASRGEKAKLSMFSRQYWRDAFDPAKRKERAAARAEKQAQVRHAKPVSLRALGVGGR